MTTNREIRNSFSDSAISFDDSDQESNSFDDDDHSTNPTSLISTVLEFNYIKVNKFGMKRDRTLQVNRTNKHILVYDAKGQFKKQIDAESIVLIEDIFQTNKVKIGFKPAASHRHYDLEFANDPDKHRFMKIMTELITSGKDVAFNDGKRLFESRSIGYGKRRTELPTFKVYLTNKFGMNKLRIIMIDISAQSMFVLNEKQKIVAQYLINDITAVELKAFHSAAQTAEIQFRTRTKPFVVHFIDSCDLFDFRDQLTSVNQGIAMEAEESIKVRDDKLVRFVVVDHSTKLGTKAKKIIYVDTVARLMHLVVQGQRRKKILGEDVIEALRDVQDKRKVNMRIDNTRNELSNHKTVKWKCFAFPTAESRDAFFTMICSISNQNEQAAAMSTQRIPESNVFPVDDAESLRAMRLPKRLPQMVSSPDSIKNIFVGSWNVGSLSPTKDVSIADWISPEYDVYVIGLQECKKRDQWMSVFDEYFDTSCVLLQTHAMWELCIFVYIRPCYKPYCSEIYTDSVPTGIGDVLGNKGAVAISFRFRDSRLCFVVCHLAARAEKVQERKDNYVKIMRGLKQLGSPKGIHWFNHFHHQVCFGDLNYRLEANFDSICQLVELNRCAELVAFDQLIPEIKRKSVFNGFGEGPLNFSPTYRMERQVHRYSNKRDQSPSYTDRILYRSMPDCASEFVQTEYMSSPETLGSDHRPVRAAFRLTPRGPMTLEVDPQPAVSLTVAEWTYLPDEQTLQRVGFLSNPKAIVRLVFTSEVLDSNLSSRPAIQLITMAAANDDQCRVQWTWSTQLLPTLNMFIRKWQFLNRSHLQVMLIAYPNDGAPKKNIGSASIAFKGLFDDDDPTGSQSKTFQTDVYHRGLNCGIMTGTMHSSRIP